MDNVAKMDAEQRVKDTLAAVARKLVLAKETCFTGKLTVTFDLNQGGVTFKKFVQEWTEK